MIINIRTSLKFYSLPHTAFTEPDPREEYEMQWRSDTKGSVIQSLRFKPWQRNIIADVERPCGHFEQVVVNVVFIDSPYNQELFELRNYICNYTEQGYWILTGVTTDISSVISDVLALPPRPCYMFITNDETLSESNLLPDCIQLQGGLGGSLVFPESVHVRPKIWMFTKSISLEQFETYKKHIRVFEIVDNNFLSHIDFD